ncbi:unnamed protein product, partial [Prorocentrum cordatum]
LASLESAACQEQRLGELGRQTAALEARCQEAEVQLRLVAASGAPGAEEAPTGGQSLEQLLAWRAQLAGAEGQLRELQGARRALEAPRGRRPRRPRARRRRRRRRRVRAT